MKSIEGNFNNPDVNDLLNKHFIELRSVSPARKLFKIFGFIECQPFAHYKVDPNSCYYTLEL